MPQRIIHYADDSLDRAAMLREDAAWIDERLRAATTCFVAVLSDKHLISNDGVQRPCFLSASDIEGSLPREPILLGVRGDVAYFTLDVTDTPPPLPNGVALLTLREVIADLGHADSAVLAYAGALVHWNRTHRYCGVCGSLTVAQRGGHVRRCTHAACGREHFPRTDPAVITLVINGDRCLLAHRRGWGPGRHSTVAGFVEPGETLEHAVVREVFEETGVAVGEVRYRGSQPWPFPQSLMIGFRAVAKSTNITVDGDEIVQADWYDAERIRTETKAGTLILPPSDSISHRLIDDWLTGTA